MRRRALSSIALFVASATTIVALFAGCSDATVAASGDRASGVPGATTSAGTTSGVAVAPPTATTVPPTPTPTPEGPQPLQVVAFMGETGVMRPIDAPALAGVQAQIERLNEQGGLLERPIELTRIDTQSRLSLADRFAQRLDRIAPDLLIVTCDVTFAEPVLDYARAHELVTISPCADDNGYTTAAWGPRNFTLGAPAEARGALAAQVAFTRYGPTAIVLRDRTSPEALRFCDGFERAFREFGGTVAYRDEFTYETPEPLLDRLAASGPQTSSIAVCSHVPGGTDAAPNVIEQLRLRGFEAPIVAGSTLDEATWFADVPSLGELTYVSWSSIYGHDPNDAVNRLIERVNDIARDGEGPPAGATTVLGADSIDAWARAVEAVRTEDATLVASALASFDRQEFLTGSVSFTGGTRIDASRTYRVIRVADGNVQEPELATVEG